MKLLPKWVLTDKFPALYDAESGTCIEMTSRVYGAMNELITEYNEFVDRANTMIEEYETGSSKDMELFKVGLRQEFQDFIDLITIKVAELDGEVGPFIDSINTIIRNHEVKITNAENYMRKNIVQTATDLINGMIAEREFQLDVEYVESEESLSFHAGGGLASIYNEEDEGLSIIIDI